MTFPNILLIFFLTKKFGYMKYYSYLCIIPDKEMERAGTPKVSGA